MKNFILVCFASLLFTAVNSNAEPVENAYKICKVVDETVPVSKPCEVSGWNSSVDFSVDTSTSDARKLCTGIAALAKENGIVFSKGWKMRVYSPFSNGNTIAVCSLE